MGTFLNNAIQLTHCCCWFVSFSQPCFCFLFFFN